MGTAGQFQPPIFHVQGRVDLLVAVPCVDPRHDEPQGGHRHNGCQRKSLITTNTSCTGRTGQLSPTAIVVDALRQIGGRAGKPIAGGQLSRIRRRDRCNEISGIGSLSTPVIHHVTRAAGHDQIIFSLAEEQIDPDPAVDSVAAGPGLVTVGPEVTVTLIHGTIGAGTGLVQAVNRVVAGPADDQVATGITFNGVITRPTIKDVTAFTTMHLVVARLTHDPVVAGSTIERVRPVIRSVQDIVAGIAKQLVASPTATVQFVIVRTSVKLVRPRTSVQDVVPVATIELVVTALTMEPVVSSTPEQSVMS